MSAKMPKSRFLFFCWLAGWLVGMLWKAVGFCTTEQCENWQTDVTVS